MKMTRKIRGMNVPSSAHYVRSIAGCLPGFAARNRCPDLGAALAQLNREIIAYFGSADFSAKYNLKLAALGIVDERPSDTTTIAA